MPSTSLHFTSEYSMVHPADYPPGEHEPKPRRERAGMSLSVEPRALRVLLDLFAAVHEHEVHPSSVNRQRVRESYLKAESFYRGDDLPKGRRKSTP